MVASNRVIVTKASSNLRMVFLLASEIEGSWEPKLSLLRKCCQEKGGPWRRPGGTGRCDYAERFFFSAVWWSCRDSRARNQLTQEGVIVHDENLDRYAHLPPSSWPYPPIHL